jgi:Carboxypeptidase regulatory-like domain/TonB dependent receptor
MRSPYHARSAIRFVRTWLSALVMLGMVLTSAVPAFAVGGQTGALQGTVVDGGTKAPVAGATIVAAAPSARYTATTDKNGFFQLNGVTVDTYSLSITAAGYETFTLSGVTVQGDQTVNLGAQTLAKALRQIGRTSARSQSSVFQPSQTTDEVTVSGARATQALGKALNTSENQLALSIPGVQLTNLNRLTIRGGLSSEVGYQLDGVNFTEPFLNQNGGNGFFNGLASLQVVAGAGDASQGNIGGGVVNVVVQRGTYPPSGLLDVEIGGPSAFHQAAIQYGFASPNGRFSDYVSYVNQRYVPYFGGISTSTDPFGVQFAVTPSGGVLPSSAFNQDFLNNFVYKFGKDNTQSLQVLFQNRDFDTFGDRFGGGALVPYYNNPYFHQGLGFSGGATAADAGDPLLNNAFLSRVVDKPFNAAPLGSPNTPELIGFNPSQYLKFEYDNVINGSTFLALRAYNLQFRNGGTNYYDPQSTGNDNITGGNRTGFSGELTKTFSSKHTVEIGGSMANIHPIWDAYQPYPALLDVEGAYAGAGFVQLASLNGFNGALPNLGDFATPADYGGACPAATANNPNPCYLYNHGITNPHVPSFGIGYNKSVQIQSGFFVRDQWTPSPKLKFDLGLRVDTMIYKQGANPFNPTDLANPDDVPVGGTAAGNFLSQGFLRPTVTQPRLAASYQFDPNNSLRFGFARSVVFANAQTQATPSSMYDFPAAFFNIPATGNTADPTTWSCGTGFNAKHLLPGGANASANGGGYFRCNSYAQQLYYFLDQNNDAPDAGNNIPEQFSNTELAYQHLFHNGWGARATAYYKRGFNISQFSLISQVLNAQGVPVSQVFGITNTGINKTTGLELGLTTPQRAVGLSGYLSATYTNVIGSVPPLVGSEDVLPLVPAASVALNNTYRAGYVSPFVVNMGLQFRTKSGFKINPILNYDRGYPFGVGNLIATALPDGTFANLPQTNANPPIVAGFGGISGAFNATNYVDPTNPGTLANPNIAATRGTPESANAGGVLSRPRLTADVDFEYTRKRNTLGLYVQNLFSNQYLEPQINPYWQPVTTGVGGVQTGTNSAATPGTSSYVYGGFRDIPGQIHGTSPYVQNLYRPLSLTLYYQLHI